MIKRLILTTVATSTILFASSTEDFVKLNGCMECHNIMGQKQAPAFKGVAKKNTKLFGSDAKVNIINGIKNGSQGKYRKFKHTSMPEYNYFTANELDKIATWILEQYNKNKSR